MLNRRTLLKSAVAAPWAATLGACSTQDEVQGGFVGSDMARGHALRDGANQPTGTPDLRKTQVVIVGGGIAGLAAARTLRQRGIDDFVLLELEDHAGGNAQGTALGGMPCPLGAHYLPLPGADATEVQALLAELGLLEHTLGRWHLTAQGEQHLCHSPQERLHYQGHWQEGLLPVHGAPPEALAAYQRFAALVEAQRQPGKFTIPVQRVAARWHDELAALDAISFAQWLDQHGLQEPHLRWYLDYCCRDEYGAPAQVVSSWAGLHYFASRHGFTAPGLPLQHDPNADDEGLLVWPQGNGWLVQQLAQPLGERLHTAHVVHRVEVEQHGVLVDALHAPTGRAVRWQAQHCLLATPLFISARILQGADSNLEAALQQAARQVHYAPWLVANLQLRHGLRHKAGNAPLAWDNVVYGSQALGYVNARHQSLLPYQDATVLTWYQTLCEAPGNNAFRAARMQLMQAPWTHWRDHIVQHMRALHPDLPAALVRLDVARWGHGMACPVPGSRSNAALAALSQLPASSRVQLCHADLSGYSVFEEAFYHGARAAQLV